MITERAFILHVSDFKTTGQCPGIRKVIKLELRTCKYCDRQYDSKNQALLHSQSCIKNPAGLSKQDISRKIRYVLDEQQTIERNARKKEARVRNENKRRIKK